MYICGMCKKSSYPGQQSHSFITDSRDVSYSLLDSKGNKVNSSSGWEIVNELRICEVCLKREMEAANVTGA